MHASDLEFFFCPPPPPRVALRVLPRARATFPAVLLSPNEETTSSLVGNRDKEFPMQTNLARMNLMTVIT